MVVAISQVRNAKSLQLDNTRMDVEINHPMYGWIPYTLDPSDTDSTINNDEIMALIGTDFTAFVAPTTAEINAALAADVRAERNTKLAESDWRASQDVTMSDAWRTYRQALRDVPAQSGFPTNVTWPIEPL
ncbi:MAG: hypothetical protein HOI09_05210 [Porticoccaceae bacterium]|jgi:hypothetical protein|nr:hypothetical protein [Porticoccaceae bacterium]